MASFKGEPLLAHAVRRLTQQGFRVAINAPPTAAAAQWAGASQLAVLSDDPADPVGPLAGVKAGLIWAQSAGASVLVTSPCDTPALPARMESHLADHVSENAWAATAKSPTGLQSLCTAWRVEPALRALKAHFAAGRHPAVHELLTQIGAVEVCFPDDAAFANLNTWKDFVQAEGRKL